MKKGRGKKPKKERDLFWACRQSDIFVWSLICTRRMIMGEFPYNTTGRVVSEEYEGQRKAGAVGLFI